MENRIRRARKEVEDEINERKWNLLLNIMFLLETEDDTSVEEAFKDYKRYHKGDDVEWEEQCARDYPVMSFWRPDRQLEALNRLDDLVEAIRDGA